METNISNKCKAYTSLEQSKHLAEILPIESADMWYCPYPNDVDWYNEPRIGKAELLLNQLPCWSLAALLEIIPYRLNDGSDFTIEKWEDGYLVAYSASCHKYENELVDACYEMILNLNEQKLL